MSANVLGAVVASYIEDLTGALVEAASDVDGADTSTFEVDVTNEAFNLCVAMIDSDGRHTDDELNALIDTFGPRMADQSELLLATPADLRDTSLVAGRRAWIETDSELFKVLVAADEARGTDLAEIYYERTMEVAHVIASLDVVTTQDELKAIAELRTRLLAGLRGRRNDGHSLAPRTPAAVEAPPPEQDPPQRSMEELLAELDDLVGLEAVKDRVHLVADFLRVQQLREERGLPAVDTSHHLVFTGNPGTGKTTVARLLAQIFRTLGVVDRGHLVEVDRAGLVAGYVGQTAPKVTAAFDAADEGMLFIDEAYTLKQGDNDKFGQEAIDALLKRMEDDRGKFVVVVAGYPGDMTTFLNANTGLQSRFDQRYRFHIDDYTADDLYEIFQRLLAANDFVLEDAAMSKAQRYLRECCELKDKNFGNGREARTLFDSCRSALSNRVCEFPADMPADAPDWNTIIAGDVPDRGLDQGDLASTLDKLDKLVGLKPVKQEIRNLIDYVELSNYRSKLTGMATAPLNLHFVFTGNPGTGKTTVAEELGTIFKAMGILKKGHVVEAKKSDLVGAYLGQTEPTTNQKIDEAMGGVLFIDEAYTLSRDQFGLTAIDTLLTRLEQDRGKFVAIAAGYKDDIQEFLKANAGLADRFTRYIDFPDYSLDELCEIFDRMAAVKGFTVDDVARSRVRSVLTDLYENRDDSFSNARIVRNLFEASTVSQAARLAPLLRNGGEIDHIIAEIAVDDIPASVRGQ